MKLVNLFTHTNSWKDFQNNLLSLTKKDKGNAFELLTKFFFKINPLYQFYDEVWLLSEVPQKVLEYLGIPSHDMGIDLIAKIGNEFHAIQCKYHSDKNTSVTFKEVSTFISLLESNVKLTQGYICSSADLTSRNFNKLKTKPINLIMSDSWQQLDNVFFVQVRKLLDGKKPVLKPYKPFSHQEKALKQATEHFLEMGNSRGKLIFPCGSGKSLTGFWITQELKSKSTLIAVPSLSLVKQTLEVYLREIVAKGVKVKWLCICSDEGIGKNDDVAIYTENLGVPCHTDSVYIENWLKENRDENIVVFTTYQSGRIIAEISKKLDFYFDIGIFDEAHKTVGSAKKLFSHLLFEENISVGKRIFMTATERFYTGSKDDIVSMDDDDIYGETFAQMSFKEAIELDLLTDYKIITIEVKKSEISDFIRKNNLVQLNDKWKKETEARSLASMLALRKAMKQYPIKNAVSFHSSIEKAVRNKELQQYITDTYNYQPIDTYTVSGRLPTTKRNDIVQEFADSEKALITNARCLTEGVDVPNIDCIIYADPRKSKVDIVQSLGRALRKKEGKEWGYVILPIVYNDETHEIDNDNFNEILAIVRGLASNDERIVEYFRDKNIGSATRVNTREENFNFDVISEYLNEEELAKQLQIKIWHKLSKFNWMEFKKAKAIIKNIGMSSYSEWREYYKTGNKPEDIPTNPNIIYSNNGWVGWGDWLGTGTIATNERAYKNFIEARAFVHELGLNSQSNWIKYCKSWNKPEDIPSNPQRSYKNNGWIGWGDWLGTGRIADQYKVYRNYKESRKYVQSLGLLSYNEWEEYCKTGNKPEDIPTRPNQVYKNNGWKGIGDWLGTGALAYKDIVYRDFKEARAFVKDLGLKNNNEWIEYCKSAKKPKNIPNAPWSKYKDKGWKSIGDWLGTGRVANYNKVYRVFNEAREFAQKLGLNNINEWQEFCKTDGNPEDIPASPDKTYKDKGWLGYGDWLGTGRIANVNRTYIDFEEARAFSQSLGLKNEKEWKDFCKSGNKPDDIPSNPNRTYKNKGWNGMGDWLGTGRVANYNKVYRVFNEAREFAQSLRIKSSSEWREYCKLGKKPHDVPNKPDSYYKSNGWKSWGDWLGTGIIASQNKAYRDFIEARDFVQNLCLKNRDEWRDYCKSGEKPEDIPARADRTYKNKGWLGYGDWLGKE